MAERAARKSRKEITTNLNVREVLNVQKNVIKVIEEGRLRWFRYSKWMGNDRFTKMIQECNVKDRRRKGKP